MVSFDTQVSARRLNQAYRALGGEDIRGLDRIDPAVLRRLDADMASFFDGMDQLAGSNPELAMMAGQQALQSLRAMAQIASRQDLQPLSTFAPQQSMGGYGFDPLSVNVSVNVDTASMRGGSRGDPSYEATRGLGGAGGTFEDRVFELMCKIVEDMQKKIEDRLNKLEKAAKEAEKGGGGGKKGGKGGLGGILGTVGKVAGGVFGGPVGAAVGGAVGNAVGGAMGGKGGGGGAGGAGGAGGQESRNIEFEKIKFDMQKLSQMQQAMSNVLNTMDELAKSAIRQIKAG